jgi:hypothetical protein
MKCSHIQEKLAAYAEHELPLLQRWRVAWHVRGCSDCCAQLEEWVRASQFLLALRHVGEPPADLLSRITAAVEAMPEPSPQPDHAPARPHGFFLGWSWSLLATLGLAPFVASAIFQTIARSAASASGSFTTSAQWSWGVREMLLWCLSAFARVVQWAADALQGVCWGLGENHLSVLMGWEVVILCCGLLIWQRQRRARQMLMTLMTI